MGAALEMNISKECLELFKRNPQEFLGRFITVNETWIHHYIPKNNQNNGLRLVEVLLKKAKLVPLTGKVMATIFWDVHGIILIDHLEKVEQ